MLATTCIGMTIGVGLYAVGVVSTIIVFIVLEYTQFIGDKFEHLSEVKIKVKLENPKANLKEIKDILENYAFETDAIQTLSNNDLIIQGKIKEEFNKSKIFYKIMQIDDVENVLELKEGNEVVKEN